MLAYGCLKRNVKLEMIFDHFPSQKLWADIKRIVRVRDDIIAILLEQDIALVFASITSNALLKLRCATVKYSVAFPIVDLVFIDRVLYEDLAVGESSVKEVWDCR